MRNTVGSVALGENATLSFVQEGYNWTYPQITLMTRNGESATIFLQHMPPKDVHKLADEIKKIAVSLESKE